MRTIKFRVRNQHTKEIEATEYLDENGVWWYIRTGESQKYQGVLLGGYLREQFTGLLDKNGKEIYEGDIVIFDTGNPIKRDIPYPRQGTVEFLKGKWVMKGIEIDYGNAELFGREKWVEVIGNIYDNENLLTNTYGK